MQKYPHFVDSWAPLVPSSVTPLPYNKFPSRLAPRVPNSMLRNPSFCFLVSFSIVRVTSFLSMQESSKDLTIFIISCIPSFDIMSTVVPVPKIFYEFLHLMLRLPLLRLMVPTCFLPRACVYSS